MATDDMVISYMKFFTGKFQIQNCKHRISSEKNVREEAQIYTHISDNHTSHDIRYLCTTNTRRLQVWSDTNYLYKRCHLWHLILANNTFNVYKSHLEPLGQFLCLYEGVKEIYWQS